MKDVIEATGGRLDSENSGWFSGVSIDSRTISEGGLFFAVRGEKFDGHEFVGSALAKGSGAVVEKSPDTVPEGKVIIHVDDTLRSLQDLAHFLRKQRDIPVVAVTGSNGKTTTKEMLYTVLSKKFRTLKNEGNLNNHIGLPLSLVKLDPRDEAAVLEMGMNAPGEIRRLCEIAAPTHGVITNVGSAHMGRLGSCEAVRAAKLEIMKGLGTAVINADDTYLMQGVEETTGFNGRIITFAVEKEAFVTASGITATESGIDFILSIRGAGDVSVSLDVHGIFNVYNALAAAAAGFVLGIPLDMIKQGLEEYKTFPMRFEIIRKQGITVINDAYNANPQSVEESLRELMHIGTSGRKVAVLGDMKELNGFSESAHRNTGKKLADMGIDVFVAVGKKMALAAEECFRHEGGKKGPDVYRYNDIDTAGKDIMKILKKGDTVLVKGSRTMFMERILGDIKDVI